MPKIQTLQIDISQGIDNPPQVTSTPGTIVLRPAQTRYINQEISAGKMAYGQNVNVQNDKYGRGIVLPGPYLNQLSTNTLAPIYLKSTDSQTTGGNLWFNYSNTNKFDRLTNIDSGGTPTLDTSNTITLNTTVNAGVVVDMVTGQLQGGNSVVTYVTMEQTTSSAGAWVGYFSSSDAGTAPTSRVFALSAPGVIGTPLPMVRTQFDGNIYIGNCQKIDKINVANSSFQSGIVLAAVGTSGSAVPFPWFFTAMGEWNGFLVGACNDEAPAGFAQRNGAGHSRIFFWDIANNPTGNYKTNFVNSPSHYISTFLTDLSGNLLCFGGVDEGRTTIYQWNGYGFDSIFSYIGDMPRNSHSVCFDSLGRLVWVTADAHLCRWDKQSDIFDNLDVVGGALQNGGICTNLQSSTLSYSNPTGYDFLVAADAWLSAVQLNAFKTGATNENQFTNVPIAISGLQTLPQNSIVNNINVTLHKALESGEKIQVRLYPSNYVTQYAAGGGNTGFGYTSIGYLDYAIDGPVTSKNVRTLQQYQTSFAIAYAWFHTTTITAPGVMATSLDYYQITTP